MSASAQKAIDRSVDTITVQNEAGRNERHQIWRNEIMIDRRKALIMLGTTVLAPVMADAATFTGTGVDDHGNTITFIQETITPSTLYLATNCSDHNNVKTPTTPCHTTAKIN